MGGKGEGVKGRKWGGKGEGEREGSRGKREGEKGDEVVIPPRPIRFGLAWLSDTA